MRSPANTAATNVASASQRSGLVRVMPRVIEGCSPATSESPASRCAARSVGGSFPVRNCSSPWSVASTVTALESSPGTACTLNGCAGVYFSLAGVSWVPSTTNCRALAFRSSRSDGRSRGPGNAVLGSRWAPKKVSSVVTPRANSDAGGWFTTPPRSFRRMAGRSRGTNGPVSTWLRRPALRTAATPAARSGDRAASVFHASRVSGLGASVSCTSGFAPSSLAWRPSRPVGWRSASVFALTGAAALPT